MAKLTAEEYGTTTHRPADFDAFWDGVLAQAAGIPLNARVEPIPLRSTPEVEVFEVTYDSVDNVRIACWYCRPRERRGKLPAIIHVPGYVSEPLMPKATALKGYAALSVAPRGKLRSNRQFNPGYPGLLTHNITDRNSYSYRGFYVDALRAVDFLLGQPEVDSDRIGVTGSSQGGALTIVTSAMRPEIACAAAGAPYLCGFMDSAHLTHSFPYEEINEYLRLHPEREGQVRQTLAYFDGINFAPKISCPIIVNIGLQDDVCPPETGYAVFRAIGSREKRLYPYNNCAHDAGSAWHAAIVDDFLKTHLHPGE
ncbi:MAG TPA: acetylxylan esterase [Chloroflexota bacterium]|nr:acetylxylan esterase [Chloroflexota bacterium]